MAVEKVNAQVEKFIDYAQNKAIFFNQNAIENKVESLSIPHVKNSASESVTISMGTLVVSPQIGLDPQSLYKQADELLYKAKESGRNSNIIETL